MLHVLRALLYPLRLFLLSGDPDLKEWVKVTQPFLADDMSNLPTNCFR